MRKIRITFLQDLFRTPAMAVGDTTPNVVILKRLLRPAFMELGFQVEEVAPASQGGRFDELKFAERDGLVPGVESWAHRFLKADYRGYPGLENLELSDLVVGWGLPPSLINFLSHQNKDFIDFELSPIRFGEGLFMRARTNNRFIHEILNGFSPTDQELFLSAQKLSVSYGNEFQSLPQATWAYFIGQTQVDAALIEEGVLRKPSEALLMSEISELAQEVDFLGVVTRPHGVGLNHLLPILQKVSNAVVVPGRPYEYLARASTKFVVSLSSGVISEARYFGIEAYGLIKPDAKNPAKYENEIFETQCVDTRVFCADFWRQVFLENSKVPDAAPIDADLITPLFSGSTGRDFPPSALNEPLRPISATGSMVNVSTDDRIMLSYGWHESEAEGVWSDGEVASLFLRVGQNQKIKLGIHGRSFHPANFVSTEVQVKVVGADSDVRLLEPSVAEISEEFTVDAPASGLISVQFFVRNPFSPWQAGYSEDRRRLGIWLQGVSIGVIPDTGLLAGIPDSSYYQALHTFESSYQVNNWLLPFSGFLRRMGFRKVIECGTGNGLFVSAMGGLGIDAEGLDWAASPFFPHSSQGVKFSVWNAISDPIPAGDLCCSADFLEHVHDDHLDQLLERMIRAAPSQFHLIACYDDGHSHLSVLSPQDWLNRFQAAQNPERTEGELKFEVVEIRRGSGQLAIIISNVPGIKNLMSSDIKDSAN